MGLSRFGSSCLSNWLRQVASNSVLSCSGGMVEGMKLDSDQWKRVPRAGGKNRGPVVAGPMAHVL